MTVKVKICGLTNKEDAVWALNYGADFLGINFYKESPRHISLAGAKKWVPELPAFANVIGVFVDPEIDDVTRAVESLGLKGVQFHGNESPGFLSSLRLSIEGLGRSISLIKAIRVEGQESIDQLKNFAQVCDFFLLDSFLPQQLGGTGTSFNWDLAVQAKQYNKPFFLAGGLTPENVKAAVKKVEPFAVDVASGVEKSVKKKDPSKVQEFIANARK